MSTPFDTFTISHDGHEFRVSLYPDDGADPPWESCDGHGPIRFVSYRESLERGETVLFEDRHGKWVYNIGAAILQASREKWGLCADDVEKLAQKLGKKPTKAQIRMASIRADMDYLRGYVSGEWSYCVMCVNRLDDDGEPIDEPFSHCLGGVETSSQSYMESTAAELAAESLHTEGLDSDTQALCLTMSAPMATVGGV